MKKNIARCNKVVAVAFFLWLYVVNVEASVDVDTAPSGYALHDGLSEHHRGGSEVVDDKSAAPVSDFDEFHGESTASEVKTVLLATSLDDVKDDALFSQQEEPTDIPQMLMVPQSLPSATAATALKVSRVAQALSPQQPSADGPNDVPTSAQKDTTLIQIMSNIESSLKTIEDAVILKTPNSIVSPAEKLQTGTGTPGGDKSKEGTPDVGAMPDDVPIASKELETIKQISDETEFVPANGHDIKLSASMPLTGSMALVGRDYLTGINLVFDKFNRSGGLDKKYLLKYSTIDDRYISTVAKENIIKSLKDSPFFVGNFGSHLLSSVKDLVEKKHALMLFPTVGDSSFRDKNSRYFINLRPSINAELRALVRYAVNNQQRKKIAVFYEENQWGKSGLSAVEKALADFGLTPCAKANYPPNTIAVMPASSEIIKSRPDAVICVSTYRPTYNFIQLILNEGFQHCLFLGLGPATPMQQLLKKSRGVTIATTSVVPDPVKSKLPIVEAYRKDMTRYFPLRELSQYSLEGYIAGSIFVSALKQLEAPYTVGKLLSFFEDLKKKDFGGFKINFNPETRELSSRVWINKGNPDAEWDDSFSDGASKVSS